MSIFLLGTALFELITEYLFQPEKAGEILAGHFADAFKSVFATDRKSAIDQKLCARGKRDWMSRFSKSFNVCFRKAISELKEL